MTGESNRMEKVWSGPAVKTEGGGQGRDAHVAEIILEWWPVIDHDRIWGTAKGMGGPRRVE